MVVIPGKERGVTCEAKDVTCKARGISGRMVIIPCKERGTTCEARGVTVPGALPYGPL